MSRRGVHLRDLVAQARELGTSGEASPYLAQVSCAIVLDALDAADDVRVDALVAPVGASRNAFDESLLASASGRSWLVSGESLHVAAARDAQTFLTVVRSRPFAGRARGLRVYFVEADTPGITVAPCRTIDDDRAAHVMFDAVQIGDERAIGPPRDATTAIEIALDRITVVVVAEMLAAADAARRTAIAWVAQRVQFGEPLARRQAVAHRVADMTIACDAIGLLLEHALASADANAGRPDPLAVATAKLQSNIRLPDVTASAHQLHGGEGYYADRPLHRWNRRVNSLAMQFGDRRAMRAHSAELLGLPSAF
jgi:alkylation response protein AidB-like acyl-CoA dehydrogenase